MRRLYPVSCQSYSMTSYTISIYFYDVAYDMFCYADNIVHYVFALFLWALQNVLVMPLLRTRVPSLDPRPCRMVCTAWNLSPLVWHSALLEPWPYAAAAAPVPAALIWSHDNLVYTGIYQYIQVYTGIYYAHLRKSMFWYDSVYTVSNQVFGKRKFSYLV